jgi:hypothetical protein
VCWSSCNSIYLNVNWLCLYRGKWINDILEYKINRCAGTFGVKFINP